MVDRMYISLLLLVAFFQESRGTFCNDVGAAGNIRVASFCKSSQATGNSVLIDGYPANGKATAKSCSCRAVVKLPDKSISSLVSFTAYYNLAPNYVGCGSAVIVTDDTNHTIRMACKIAGSVTAKNNGTIKLQLVKEKIPEDTRYCLNVKAQESSAIISVTCSNGSLASTTTSSSTSSTTTNPLLTSSSKMDNSSSSFLSTEIYQTNDYNSTINNLTSTTTQPYVSTAFDNTQYSSKSTSSTDSFITSPPDIEDDIDQLIENTTFPSSDSVSTRTYFTTLLNQNVSTTMAPNVQTTKGNKGLFDSTTKETTTISAVTSELDTTSVDSQYISTTNNLQFTSTKPVPTEMTAFKQSTELTNQETTPITTRTVQQQVITDSPTTTRYPTINSVQTTTRYPSTNMVHTSTRSPTTDSVQTLPRISTTGSVQTSQRTPTTSIEQVSEEFISTTKFTHSSQRAPTTSIAQSSEQPVKSTWKQDTSSVTKSQENNVTTTPSEQSSSSQTPSPTSNTRTNTSKPTDNQASKTDDIPLEVVIPVACVGGIIVICIALCIAVGIRRAKSGKHDFSVA